VLREFRRGGAAGLGGTVGEMDSLHGRLTGKASPDGNTRPKVVTQFCRGRR
jgi:hypothetical protein